MINCVVSGWVDCSCPTPSDKCQITIDICYLATLGEVDLEEFLTEKGWLYLNEDSAYCPECKEQLCC